MNNNYISGIDPYKDSEESRGSFALSYPRIPKKVLRPLSSFSYNDVVLSESNWDKCDGLIIDENNTRVLIKDNYLVLATGEKIELDETELYIKLFTILD